jgi:hypothetical protein
MRLVTPSEDYRSEKMDSIEGLGVARRRWFGYLGSLPPDVLKATDFLSQGTGEFIRSHASVAELRKISEGAKEYSELIGFWVAWHVAGGFDELENSGWHRATIFRKIKRFRDSYGAHPDEYEFSWLKIDLEAAWGETVRAILEDRRGPASKS